MISSLTSDHFDGKTALICEIDGEKRGFFIRPVDARYYVCHAPHDKSKDEEWEWFDEVRKKASVDGIVLSNEDIDDVYDKISFDLSWQAGERRLERRNKFIKSCIRTGVLISAGVLSVLAFKYRKQIRQTAGNVYSAVKSRI